MMVCGVGVELGAGDDDGLGRLLLIGECRRGADGQRDQGGAAQQRGFAKSGDGRHGGSPPNELVGGVVAPARKGGMSGFSAVREVS
jgi:hypothetical protein